MVVTDSTACLTPEDARRWGLVVVPLDVAADGTRYRDGVDLTGDGLVELLGSGRRVTTSQPAPAAFVQAYEQAALGGAVEVVSVHLSGELSGTVRAAGLAAQLAPLPVRVVDSRSAGLGLGLAAIAAAEAAGGGWPTTSTLATGTDPESGAPRRSTRRGPLPRSLRRSLPGRRWRGSVTSPSVEPAGAWVPDGAVVARTAERVGRSTSAWFLVDSLDHLRRGGRLSGPAAALGTVLGLRPVLTLRAGRIDVAERVRTRRAARDRLVELAVTEAARRVAGGSVDGAHGEGPSDVGARVRIGVQHLGRAEIAEGLAARIRTATGLGEDDVLVREVGAVLGGHLGVGVLAVVITGR